MTTSQRRTSLRFALILTFATGVLVGRVGGYVEVVKDWGCHTTEFRLTCRDLDSQIAILEAFFNGNTTVANNNCSTIPDGSTTRNASSIPPFLVVGDNETSIFSNASSLLRVTREASSSEEIQIRLPVKHRCSGVNHCSFRLATDYTPAEDWGPGVVFIKYACINHEHINKHCQQDILVDKEGYVETPGYPQYNVERGCTWRFRAPQGQRVHLSFLDISLRGIGSMETECTDVLKVTEGDRELLSRCGEEEQSPILIESTGREINVTVSIRSKVLFPKRGVLFQYKAIGCPPLKTPKDGYLVDRNISDAEYMCCVGFVFPDTNRRERSMHCINGNTWTQDLPNCISDTSIWAKNSSLIRDMETNLTTEVAAVIKESDFIYDIMLPTLIICVLLIGNGIIIFVIFYLRKRQEETCAASGR